MALTKDRLIADSSDLLNSDKVASLTLDAAGTGITSTLEGTKQGLDVYVANAINVDLDHTTDSIQLGDGTTLVGATLNNELKVNDASANTALSAIKTAVELIDNAVSGNELQVDIVSQPALAYATDSVTAHQGGTWSVTATATDLDIRNLAYTQDSVSIAPQSAVKSTAVAGSTTAVALPTSPLANRQNIYIQNNTNKDLFIGASSVTTATGMRVAKGATVDFPFGAGIVLYGISGVGVSGNIIVLEIA